MLAKEYEMREKIKYSSKAIPLRGCTDPKLEDARRQVELAMLGADIEEVKEDALVRENLKSKVDAILGKFEW